MGVVIHIGGLLPPSSGPVRVKCGRRVPFDKNHVGIFNVRRPNGSRWCKVCWRVHRNGYWFKHREKSKRFAKKGT